MCTTLIRAFTVNQMTIHQLTSSQTCKLKAHSADTVAATTNPEIPLITLAICPTLNGAMTVKHMTIHPLTICQTYKIKTHSTGTVATTTNRPNLIHYSGIYLPYFI